MPSHGLFQIQLLAAQDVGFRGKPQDLMVPSINTKYAAKYLKKMLDKTHYDYAQALTCYNSDPRGHMCKSKKYSKYVGLILNALIMKK